MTIYHIQIIENRLFSRVVYYKYEEGGKIITVGDIRDSKPYTNEAYVNELCDYLQKKFNVITRILPFKLDN